MATREYGWTSAQAPCSCDVLTPRIIRILRQLGVATVLDVGCGNGVLCSRLQREGFAVAGAEYDQAGCELARQAHPCIPFFHVGVYDSPAPILESRPEGFDCVVSTEVVEHLYSPPVPAGLRGARAET